MIPKYRAWIKEEERIADVYCLDWFGVFNYEDVPKIGVLKREGAGMRFLNKSQFELMQWTGLVDKCGVEAFQDDLINWDGDIFRIVKTSEFIWQLENKKVSVQLSHLPIIEASEIVGNFWTNPELLEGAERE